MYIAIGQIIQTYGIQGYVKVIPYSGLPRRLMDLRTVYIETAGEMGGFIIEEIKLQNNVSLIKLRGIESREAARKLIRKEIWIPESQKITLPEDSYFIHDLIGMKVFDTEGNYLGILQEVLSNAGNDVYQVHNGEREILIPAVSEFVKQVNLKQRKIFVQLIEGMVE